MARDITEVTGGYSFVPDRLKPHPVDMNIVIYSISTTLVLQVMNITSAFIVTIGYT